MKLIGENIVLSSKSLDYFSNFLQSNSYSKLFVLTDTNTHQYCFPLLPSGFDFIEINIKNGDTEKSKENLFYVLDKLIENNADRDSMLINLGGGMITDLGGFAASIFQRGIRFINLPTSLLGMVDASYGGKTGINYNHLKNYIGTFSHPDCVFIHPPFLDTLPEREYKSGYVEMLKHGLIDNRFYWEDLNEKNKRFIKQFIEKSVDIKYRITEEDPLENNIRASLNLGHTIGHAIESWCAENNIDILHGEAVAIGIICECFINLTNGFLEEDLQEIIINLLPYTPPHFYTENDINDLVKYCKKDKKNNKSDIRIVLLKEIGKVHENIFTEVSETEIKTALSFYLSLKKP